MATTQTLTISGTLPSFNEYQRANRAHWSIGAKFKKDIEERIGWQILANHLKPVSKAAAIDITWYETDFRRDWDNIASSVKFILDSLVKQRILPDDSRKWIKSIWHTVAVDRANPRVEVTIREEES